MLALALVVCAAWGTSRWRVFNYCFKVGEQDCDVFVTRGFIGCWKGPSGFLGSPSGWSVEPLEAPSMNWSWWFRSEQSNDRKQWHAAFGVACVSTGDLRPSGPYVGVWMLLWPVALALTSIATAVLWSGARARRRAMIGCCRACGYSLAGLGKGSACPECGKETEAA